MVQNGCPESSFKYNNYASLGVRSSNVFKEPEDLTEMSISQSSSHMRGSITNSGGSE